MPLDLAPPQLWLPPKPAIIRPADDLTRPPWWSELVKPGFLPGTVPVVGKSAAPITFSFVASATASTNSCTVPGTAAANDLAVLLIGDGDTGILADPSGWTVMGTSLNSGGSVPELRCYRKKLVSGDVSSSVTWTSGSGTGAIMAIFRPSRSATFTNNTWVGSGSTNGNPAAQTVSASGQATPLIVFGCAYAVSGSFSFSTASPAFDSVIGFDAGSPYLLLGYKIDNTSPADHSIDMNDQGTFNNLLSGYVSAA